MSFKDAALATWRVCETTVNDHEIRSSDSLTRVTSLTSSTRAGCYLGKRFCNCSPCSLGQLVSCRATVELSPLDPGSLAPATPLAIPLVGTPGYSSGR